MIHEKSIIVSITFPFMASAIPLIMLLDEDTNIGAVKQLI